MCTCRKHLNDTASWKLYLIEIFYVINCLCYLKGLILVHLLLTSLTRIPKSNIFPCQLYEIFRVYPLLCWTSIQSISRYMYVALVNKQVIVYGLIVVANCSYGHGYVNSVFISLVTKQWGNIHQNQTQRIVSYPREYMYIDYSYVT